MSDTTNFFLYGTLKDPELLSIVAGADASGAQHNAVLRDHSVFWVDGETFPILVNTPGHDTGGILLEAKEDVVRRMSFYELGFDYGVRTFEVETADGALAANAFIPPRGRWTPSEPWSLADWQTAHGALAREAAKEFMRLMDTHSMHKAAKCFPQIRMRAASRLRARAHPSPDVMTPSMSLGDVAVTGHRQPYTNYFAVEEHDLSFPRFGGGMSETVTRASFLGGDAVTVLPYDPVSDNVLVIRQFRHGVFARGDTNPWTIEPAAGRIDPGESPEETVQRELREETGAAAISLHKVAEYYPSPSAYSEFLYSFVAVADLSGQDGTTSGLETEHEDIMSHVLPFDTLMQMVSTGAANTAPLVISALWLATNRDTLRRMD